MSWSWQTLSMFSSLPAIDCVQKVPVYARVWHHSGWLKIKSIRSSKYLVSSDQGDFWQGFCPTSAPSSWANLSDWEGPPLQVARIKLLLLQITYRLYCHLNDNKFWSRAAYWYVALWLRTTSRTEVLLQDLVKCQKDEERLVSWGFKQGHEAWPKNIQTAPDATLLVVWLTLLFSVTFTGGNIGLPVHGE